MARYLLPHSFKGFLDYLGIVHRKGIPYWPQSNGEVERRNETLLKIKRIAALEGKDWKRALRNFVPVSNHASHSVWVFFSRAPDGSTLQ